jgi:hypothetical protein
VQTEVQFTGALLMQPLSKYRWGQAAPDSSRGAWMAVRLLACGADASHHRHVNGA